MKCILSFIMFSKYYVDENIFEFIYDTEDSKLKNSKPDHAGIIVKRPEWVF